MFNDPYLKLNERQRYILKIIMEKYIIENSSISSLMLARTEDLKRWSSATIRNEMAVLEEKGYLRKENCSSGKIPTKLGYRFYIESLMDEVVINENWKLDIKSKLIEIFSDRHSSVDQVLDSCTKLISEFLNLPIVLVKFQNSNGDFLRKIDIVNIDRDKYMIYLITARGEIINDTIIIDDSDEQKKSDLMAAIRLLNEELSNCQINEISNKLDLILPSLKKRVHQFEFVYESIISQMIINNFLNKNSLVSKVYNIKSIVFQPEIQKKQVSLNDIFNLLENYSAFSPFNYNFLKTGSTLINLENEIEGVSVVSTNLNVDLTTHQLAVVGPIRMNYPLIKHLFDFLSEKLSSLNFRKN
ncbi:heat-inducible transcription repressor HrcA [Mycoplasma haemofelis str. Langford 1]|uniref:Heat-inducible transcription repressor HrcA n=2 Tax=Mycoplasma haemofelis TaxID=29501 RepID=F6FJA6_MYCHI|nr:HrcA family transcriptional regulator [Mycoplasma haemofelis]AEG72325.1 heat-inducible transcription repressor, HrcA [Mycoplasma haemofelis Ohio2]CBY92011.1 heat-inducible transcription repressor HrcA [Mycoplasma haemofelis str. Langford 1]